METVDVGEIKEPKNDIASFMGVDQLKAVFI